MSLQAWHKSGDPYIWLNAGAVSVCILLVTGLLYIIAVNGLGHFWPQRIASFDYPQSDGKTVHILGEVADQETVPVTRLEERLVRLMSDKKEIVGRTLYKVGNRREFNADFRWVLDPLRGELRYPQKATVVERREWGNFYGYIRDIKIEGKSLGLPGEALWTELRKRVNEAQRLFGEIRHIEKNRIGDINYQIEQLRLEEKRLRLNEVENEQAYRDIEQQERELKSQYNDLIKELETLKRQLDSVSMVGDLSNGRRVEISMANIVRAYRPNAMGLTDKGAFYLEKLWEFVSEEPREANTEGGIFPAIFGTVMMVMIMAVMVTPFGVIAAVYMREYAKQGPVTRAIRIAVNNLAGVPSIVYGIFGLGFFVYFIGGTIDELFYPASLPQPTFGTPGIFWASLTLAILTLPVVIVATEEGLTRVPRSIREGSLALGATKAETLWRTVLPMTASAMMTGLILAVARAAGEVAPLMLVGVVKLAPSLPLDGNFPYLHLERKFMHLGFHIYDVGFQSPNVEAARPLVYATSLLLVLIIIVLNLTAIRIRNRLREKFRAAEQN